MTGPDHLEEMPTDWVAAVCNRGIRHSTNDDAAAVRATSGQRAVLVVCDGVSSATRAAEAAQTASQLVADALAHPEPNDAQRLSTAISQANAAVAALATDPAQPPSCTVAAAVVTPESLVVGWVGDSRVYWFPDGAPAELLTIDDSMAQLRIEWGVERDLAEHGPGAHTITRWLGLGSPTDPPHIVERDVESAGWVLACSDGLWNYASGADELAHVMQTVLSDRSSSASPLELARALVTWANDQGGADNVTVAVARLGAELAHLDHRLAN